MLKTTHANYPCWLSSDRLEEANALQEIGFGYSGNSDEFCEADLVCKYYDWELRREPGFVDAVHDKALYSRQIGNNEKAEEVIQQAKAAIGQAKRNMKSKQPVQLSLLDGIAASEQNEAIQDLHALTLHQPYASLIANGFKTSETRSRPLKWRGWLAIHAGKHQMTKAELVHYWRLCDSLGFEMPLAEMPRGAIIAIAKLTDCYRMTEANIAKVSRTEKLVGNWQPGRFAYVLENVTKLRTPVPARGYQGLWIPDEGLNIKIKQEIKDAVGSRE